jgi:hypothetical protein
LTFFLNADMMSDMSTFTVRELDRTPSVVLRACDAEGVAVIRSRSGRSYEIRPVPSSGETVDKEALRLWLARHKAWMKKNAMPPLSALKRAELDRLIAGE